MPDDRSTSWRLGAMALAVAGLCLCGPAVAADPPQIKITLKDHKFDPAEIHVKAGQPTVLVVTNQDTTPEEFDSSALHVEKVIVGGHYGVINLHPLAAGRFPFMGEFHPGTAKGVVISE